MDDDKGLKTIVIKGWIRALVTIFGLATWIAGGVATFVSTDGAGSTTLIVTGSFALLFAGAGRWPTKIVMGGNGIDMSNVEAEGKIEATEERRQQDIKLFLNSLQENLRSANLKTSSPEVLVKKLESLESEVAKSTGIAAVRAYDSKVGKFLKQNFPNAEIRSSSLRSNRRVDFELVFTNKVSLLIETKYLTLPSSRFVGKSLDSLIDQMSDGAPLLVIANVEDVEIAREKLQTALGQDRADVIGWLGTKDDKRLLAAIKRLTVTN